MREEILKIEDLKVYFPVKWGLLRKEVKYVKAVDGVNLNVEKGSIHAIVGESGSGKTTLLRTVLRLHKPTSGRILFDGEDISELPESQLKGYRRRVQAVFQNPQTSLNPKWKVRDIIAEPIRIHMDLSEDDVEKRVEELVRLVNLPQSLLDQSPPSLSGGQAQRVAIARAISTSPDLILLDEPTSALDVSVQAQILNLLLGLRDELGLTYIIVTHDISVVRYMADYVTVMYLGKVVEEGQADLVLNNPMHPYTIALLSSVPQPEAEIPTMKRIEISGEPPSALDPPKGCRLHPRCPYAMDLCRSQEPPLVEVEAKHKVACWLHRSK
ncbi:MAG: ABC transporter ATP-binding protein [Fervidicoccaceae archaeon]